MFRKAAEDDRVGLLDLEREAYLAAFAHVFPPEHYPFPDDAVLARWRLVMDDPDVAVLVHDDPGSRGLIALVAYDSFTLRHLAVHPEHWGEGLATAAIEIALSAMDLRGSAMASLWCLEDNRRARRLYEYLGWKPTDDVREVPWSPHPLEVRYTRLIVRSDG